MTRLPDRRSWVYVAGRARCVVVDVDGNVLHRYGGYQLSCLRSLPPVYDLRYDRRRQTHVGAEAIAPLYGELCYAFYAKPTHAVKIGRSGDVMKRWKTLEAKTGMLLQPLVVWQCRDFRVYEAELLNRYDEHRVRGEWFAADPVLDDFRRRFADAGGARVESLRADRPVSRLSPRRDIA